MGLSLRIGDQQAESANLVQKSLDRVPFRGHGRVFAHSPASSLILSAPHSR